MRSSIHLLFFFVATDQTDTVVGLTCVSLHDFKPFSNQINGHRNVQIDMGNAQLSNMRDAYSINMRDAQLINMRDAYSINERCSVDQYGICAVH